MKKTSMYVVGIQKCLTLHRLKTNKIAYTFSSFLLKFIYSKKATKYGEIFP